MGVLVTSKHEPVYRAALVAAIMANHGRWPGGPGQPVAVIIDPGERVSYDDVRCYYEDGTLARYKVLRQETRT